MGALRKLWHWFLCRLGRHEFWLYGPDSDWHMHRACKWCDRDEALS